VELNALNSAVTISTPTSHNLPYEIPFTNATKTAVTTLIYISIGDRKRADNTSNAT
jgi:hypothetical protein